MHTVRKSGYFTLFELIVVAVIMSLITAIAIPQIAKVPRRMERESALTDIRNAFVETAMRARATGSALELVLDIDNCKFIVQNIESDLDNIKDWTPPQQLSEEAKANISVALSSKDSYSFPSSIEWLPEETGLDTAEDISFRFYEDGQASGLPLRFRVAAGLFELDVDKLSGDPLIQELN